MLRGVAVDHARTNAQNRAQSAWSSSDHHVIGHRLPVDTYTPKHVAVFRGVSWQHALNHPSAIPTAWEDIEQTRMLIVEEQDGLSPSTRLALHRTCTRSHHLHRWATHRRPHHSFSLTQ